LVIRLMKYVMGHNLVAGCFSIFLLSVCTPSEEQHSSAAPVTQATPLDKFGNRNIRVHDPSSIVRDGDQWWLFSTGVGIPSFHSKDLLDWVKGPPIFSNAPAWIAEAVPENRRMYYWAPDVIRLNDRFLVYYSVSSFGKNRSVIALASNRTLDPNSPDYLWQDEGPVISSQRTNNFNAIDPAVTKDSKGRFWMSFGSFWSGIKLVELDALTGKRATNAALYSIASHETIEAPYIFFHDNFYYLFVNWGFCCRGTNSTYEIRMGRSREITGPYFDETGKDLARNGGTVFAESESPFIGPGHTSILQDGSKFWVSMHFYDGTDRGASKLAIRPLKWDESGWPKLLGNE
jgi:arabinan endo-1,5-alpha-L-arabinosidase